MINVDNINKLINVIEGITNVKPLDASTRKEIYESIVTYTNDLTNHELNHCPFCGGEAEYKAWAEYGTFYAYVSCKRCGAESARVKPTIDKCAKDEAAGLWNRRT